VSLRNMDPAQAPPEFELMPPATKEDLLRRADLVSRAEEHAALARALAQLAEDATVHDLLSLSVVAEAAKQAAGSESTACERWAGQAELAEDPLLARSLHRLGDALNLVSREAEAVRAQAEGFADLAQPETR
jgi:hypothetical protein